VERALENAEINDTAFDDTIQEPVVAFDRGVALEPLFEMPVDAREPVQRGRFPEPLRGFSVLSAR
jgi:hypothetical protein